MSHLQKYSIKHASLRSDMILISHEGIIKIFDPIANGCQNNYELLLSNRGTPHIYLSPEQANCLKE
jgi:hypothetical protein